MDGTDNAKFNASSSYGAISRDPSYGPLFYYSGSGQYDFLIASNPNTSRSSSSCVGNGFTVPRGVTIADRTTFLAGSNTFLVKELEVFARETFE